MSTITEDQVREELKKVVDPELFVNIVDLGLIYVVDIKPASVEVTDEAAAAPHDASEGDSSATDASPVDVLIEMTMTSPACPAGPQLIANSRQVVANMPGVKQVEVRIVMDPPWTPDKMTDEARDQLGIF